MTIPTCLSKARTQRCGNAASGRWCRVHAAATSCLQLALVGCDAALTYDHARLGHTESNIFCCLSHQSCTDMLAGLAVQQSPGASPRPGLKSTATSNRGGGHCCVTAPDAARNVAGLCKACCCFTTAASDCCCNSTASSPRGKAATGRTHADRHTALLP
jgi:hypothetical protein